MVIMYHKMKKAKKNADTWFSRYIRLRDSEDGNCNCVTCGKMFHWKEGDCGHFMSRRYESTRFDEKNAGFQCKFCNRFNQGEQFKFSIAIDKRWGGGTSEKLLQKSRMFCKRIKYDYEVIAKEYKEKAKALGFKYK